VSALREPAGGEDRELAGAGAPPRSNGELVFAAPWESRAFGLAHALCNAGVFEWDDFRAELINEIARWEAANAHAEPYVYWARWMAALERLLAERGLCVPSALDARTREIESRPTGHDHGHSHDHAQRHDAS
jgi:nitrile hydratase accessory protein